MIEENMMKKLFFFLLLTTLASCDLLKDKELQVKIKQDMSYKEAKNILLKSGWQPVNVHILPDGTPLCNDYEKYPSTKNFFDFTTGCSNYEVQHCYPTGVGACYMVFSDKNKTYLHAVTHFGGYVREWWQTEEEPTITIHTGLYDNY